MKILLIKNNTLYHFHLPKEVKDNYWITDLDNFNNARNLINIEAKNGVWYLKSNYETKIVSTEREYEEVPINLYNFYTIKNENENCFYYLYASESAENNIKKYKILGNGIITIGRNRETNINYNNQLVEDKHADLIRDNNKWFINDNNSRMGTFVNDCRIQGQHPINNGDVIFVCGLKISVVNDIVVVNNINNAINVNSSLLTPYEEPLLNRDETITKEEELDRVLYDKDDYFYRSPRFIEDVVEEEVTIEDPPAPFKPDDTSLIVTIGSMFTMSITSMTTVLTTVTNVVQGGTTWKKAMPSLLIAGAMFCSMLVWPMINKALDKKKKIKREKERVKKYTEYIESKEQELQSIVQKQSQVLKDKYINLEECANIILRKKPNLWERGIDQADFLTLRLGIGSTPIKAKVGYSEEKFTLDEDELRKIIKPIVENTKMLENVPINMSLVEKFVTSIVGESYLTYEFFKDLFLQMITYHSYDTLKIAVLTSKEKEKNFDYLRNLPYVFSDTKQERYFACDIDETKEVSLLLEQIYQSRKNSEKEFDYKKAGCYYLIVTDSYQMYRDIGIITDVLSQTVNLGFSIVILSNKIQNLPSECNNFISVGKEVSGLFESQISGSKVEFKTEYVPASFNECISKISNIPLEINNEESSLPKVVSFLEMYNIGKVEQLNIEARWDNANPKKTLSAPIGIEKNGTLVKLDLHEKAHGPHGLIAGMTGSGKSEFIITYILSMACNYSPLDVAFILIDYKGGGLAGAFENRETGFKLPHLAGTITNLDTQEMNRSLSSIQSELRRRQKIFNEARDKLGESTVDIYKYQSFFKEGKVSEPVPHLIIVSDEFAELKSQQPEFMDQLISTARIGRSLGVHLILATQKPSGVVNDQIWSNSRFRVCLKVQDKGDSQEMIKQPDAAFIKNAGRFYLQVGYNEIFNLGQSAWCGSQYFPKDKIKKKIDQSIKVIDNIGNIINEKEDDKNVIKEESKGEEIGNILKHIVEVSESLNMKAQQLWLPKLESEIFYKACKQIYKYNEKEYILNPLIGVYDDPNNQHQGLVSMNLSVDGNSLIYGSAGSGKELLLTTMIYSLIVEHTSKEVNFYICDFGAGTLKAFSKAPHVGEVILNGQDEKINNLFKAIQGELEKRKKLFENYNGDFNTYNKNSGSKMPYIIVIINNYDAFQELYDMNDILTAISRDCNKYGIILIFSANATGAVRFKLRQNFKSNIALQFNDEDDYSVILGNTHKLYPSQTYGRGLVKLDNIFEFQTAKIVKDDEPDKIDEYIKVIVDKYPSSKVRKIPSVPKYVSIDNMYPHVKELSMIPVGINKDTIEPEFYNFSEPSTIIAANEMGSLNEFTKVVANLTSRVDNTSIIVFDTDNNLSGEYQTNVGIINSGFDSNVNKIFDCISKEYDIYVNDGYSNKNLLGYKKMIIIISNLTKFLMKIDTLTKDRFTSEIEKIRDLGNISFVFTGQVDNLKKLEYDKWYKTIVDSNCGIWVGDGIADQQLIKTNIGFKKTNNEVPENYGIVVKNSKTYLVNLTSFKKEEEDD